MSAKKVSLWHRNGFRFVILAGLLFAGDHLLSSLWLGMVGGDVVQPTWESIRDGSATTALLGFGVGAIVLTLRCARR